MGSAAFATRVEKKAKSLWVIRLNGSPLLTKARLKKSFHGATCFIGKMKFVPNLSPPI
jgi:hypothetical protein